MGALTQLRNLGLEPRLVRAIEELQREVRNATAGSLSEGALAQVRAAVGGGGGGTVIPGPGEKVIDLSPPPAITGFEATGGYGIVILTWAVQTDRRYGYAEVWRSATNNRATAVLIGTAAGNIYVDEIQDGQTRYYWVRPVNTWSDAIKGPFTPDTIAGLEATTAPNVPYLLSLLANQISTSQLTAALNSRINLIDAPPTTPGSVAARIKSEQDARIAGEDAIATQLAALAVSSDAGFDWARIWYFDATAEGWAANGGSPAVSDGLLRPPSHPSEPWAASPTALAINGMTYSQVKVRIKRTGSPTWRGRLYWRRASDATWDIGRSVAVAEPSYTGGFATVSWDALWSGTIDQIRFDLSTASDLSNYFEVDWIAIGRAAPGASSAQVTELETAKIGYCSLNGLATDHTNRAACEAAGGTWNIGLPIATAVRQVAVSDGASTLALEERFVAQRALNSGLSGQWTLKVDANGRVGGIGLAGTSPSSGPGTVEMAIVADKFWIVPPASGAGTYPPGGNVPFYVLTQPTNIDGVEVPAGVYMADAYLRNAAITNAKIKDLAVTDAKIQTVSAYKILFDTLIGRLAQINTGEFKTIFADKSFLTEANIGLGTIGTAQIADVIRSLDFDGVSTLTNITNLGTRGWAIAKNGKAVFNDVTVRGTVIAPCPGGDVELGRDVGPGTGHYGLSLSGTDFNNIFLRRFDGVTFFRVNSGGASSIEYDSQSGQVVMRGTLTASDVNASLIRNADFSAYLDMRPGAPSGYLLYTVNAKILADGSTRFSNVVAEGVYSVPFEQQFFQNGETKEFFIPTGAVYAHAADRLFGAWTAAVEVTCTAGIGLLTVGNFPHVYFDSDAAVSYRSLVFSNNNGSELLPSAGGQVFVRVRATAHINSAAAITEMRAQTIYWRVFKVT